VARSALIASEAREHARRRFLAVSKLDRFGQVLQYGAAGRQFTGSSKALKGATLRKRCEEGDRAATVGDLEGLAGLDPTK
jgi:hypothetical protein